MKIYTALVKENRKGVLKVIKSEYDKKENFKKDLVNNGYIVVAILDDKNINEIKNKKPSELPSSISDRVISFVKEILK